MSPRTLLALVSTVALATACAKAIPNFDDDETSDGTSGNDDTTSGTPNGSATSTTQSSSSTGTTSSGDMTTTGAGGSGGEGTTTASTGGAGGGTTSSTGGSPNTCSHDTCTEGIALTLGCGDPCVDTVCLADDYCCDALGGEWDDICVGEAVDLCGAQCSVGPVGGELVITEIMNNPSAVTDSNGEWFEVHNVSAASIDLLGLVIRHQPMTVDPNATVAIQSSVVVPAGGYVVLGINGNTATNGGVNVDYVYSSVNLNNTSDYLAIETGGGTTLDEVFYDSASGLNPNGKSRNLDPLHLNDFDNDDDTFFCEASSMMGGGDAGTPGIANDPCP